MTFKNNQSGNGGFIELTNDDGKSVGRLTYTLQPEKSIYIISYVMVFPEFEGKGMGKYLVEEGIKNARELGYKVHPHCSYARSVMNRMDNVSDILV